MRSRLATPEPIAASPPAALDNRTDEMPFAGLLARAAKALKANAVWYWQGGPVASASSPTSQPLTAEDLAGWSLPETGCARRRGNPSGTGHWLGGRIPARREVPHAQGWLVAYRDSPFTAADERILANFVNVAGAYMAATGTTPASPLGETSINHRAPAAGAAKTARAARTKQRASSTLPAGSSESAVAPPASKADTPREAAFDAQTQAALFDATLEALPGAFILLDARGKLLRWNQSIERVVGYSTERLQTLTMSELVVPAERELARTALRNLIGEGVPISIDIQVCHADNQAVPYHLKARRVDTPSGQYILIIARDISERQRAERDIRQAKARLDLAMTSSGVALWDWDIAANTVYLNEGFAHLLKVEQLALTRPAEEVASWTHPDDQARFRRALDSAKREPDGQFDCEYRLVRANGDIVWVLSRGRVTERDAEGQALRLLGTSMNITQRKAAEERVEYLATRDALTGLPNRVLLADRLEQGIVQAARNSGCLAFMFIDLDRFKTINDSLGHAVGDELLKRVANRMQACIRASDTVARLGGDEFAIILSELEDGDEAGVKSVAEKIVAALAMPMQIDNHALNTSCSIGISLYPRDGRDSDTLMRSADVAMYHAKEKGRNNYQFFSADMNARAQERLATENYLRLALRRNELTLVYQPRYSMRENRLIGAEALLRWQHPRRGLLTPDAFVSVAEESGMIVTIGEWVLETACAQLAEWRRRHTSFQMSVNLSVEQIRDGERLFSTVSHALRAANLPGSSLELELTESILMQSIKEKVSLLNRLGELGVSIAIDDFGTGYSSLSYLKQLPVDTIKIDASFVRDLVDDPNDHAIVQAILAMAKNLSLATVAEGVETAAQLDQLRTMGCDEFQGYLMSQCLLASSNSASCKGFRVESRTSSWRNRAGWAAPSTRAKMPHLCLDFHTLANLQFVFCGVTVH
jgi:diguanylate cyclase (GGDEF)-like protein/PAS domain S-box-containing protein